MSETKFDIRFSGQLIPGTDPVTAREQLQALFKLSDAAATRLFSGTPVTVKRDIDGETVARYRERFRVAGALIEAIPSGTNGNLSTGSADHAKHTAAAPPQPACTDPDEPDTVGLSLAPPGGWLQEQRGVSPPEVDISHLSLVPGDDWTLEDCSPAPRPARIPDISHLRLEPLTSRQGQPAEA